MSVIENREIKKRLNYLQSQLDLVDSAVGSLPILVAGIENERTVAQFDEAISQFKTCLLYTSPSPRDGLLSRMPSSA